MNNEVYEELEKLMSLFPDSFINRQLELILIPKTNTYFSLKDCFTKKDIISKVLMWCTRDIAKIGANINVDVVYHCLGNGINKELTHKFIDSGFNMEILYLEV